MSDPCANLFPPYHPHSPNYSGKHQLKVCFSVPRIIPGPSGLPNATSDAREVYDVLQSGGVAIIPTEVGRGIIASSTEDIKRVSSAKQRKADHTVGACQMERSSRATHPARREVRNKQGHR